MTLRRWLLVALGVLVLVVIGALIYARPLLLTGTGYAAHNACAVELMAGRDTGTAAEDLPPNPLVPLLRTSVDAEAQTATTSILGVLFAQTAHHTEGLGCTLADERPDLTAPEPVTAEGEADWPEGETVSAPAGDVDVEALDAVLDAAFAEDDPEGREVGTRAVVVVHEGRVVAERYADGFGPATPQLGWSMAKSVTNMMVGRLVADGTVSVQDDQLLPAWDDDRSAITIDDQLRMASGLEWDETYDLGTAITEMLYIAEDMGAFAADQPLVHEPGSHQEYSSGTTNTLCDVLHDRSGMGPELATELVFRPLGMSSAVLEPDAAGDLVCSSYLWATPRDWARFGLWALQGGEWDGEQLVDDDWMDYATTVRDIEGEPVGHAAHWWVNEQPDGSLRFPEMPTDAFWASGHDGQRVTIVPSADVVVVRMGFTPEIDSDDLGLDLLTRDVVEVLDQAGLE